LIFVGLTINDPRILGLSRIQQNGFPDDLIQQTKVYKITRNEILAKGEIMLSNYPDYFSPKYLFESGDQNPRNFVQGFGQFYKTLALLIIIGIIVLFKIGFRKATILLAWIFLAPVPAAISNLTPHAVRALFMMGSIELLASYGLAFLLGIIKSRIFKIVIVISVLCLLLLEFARYINYYYGEYAKRYAIEWQYGMKQIVEYVAVRPDIYKVYVDKIRQQPYIFFLYYLKTPLPEFLKTVKYDQSESSSYSTVLSYGRYQFGGWNPIESYPSKGILYVVTPSYYDGLSYKNFFDVVKLIKYPNGNNAFFLVEGYEP
jgi:hypothetical protein